MRTDELPPDSLCERCDMPRWDHGDGSPTDHPFVKKPDLRPCDACGLPEPFPAHAEGAEGLYALDDGDPGDDLNAITAHPYAPPPMPTARPAAELALPYSQQGRMVYRDGEEYMEGVEPEAAQSLVELLNEAVLYDRDSRNRVTAKVRKERVEFLEDVLDNPSKTLPRYSVETPAHWAARAVMHHVDRWL